MHEERQSSHGHVRGYRVATLTLAGGIALAGGLGFDPPVPYDTDGGQSTLR